MIALEAVVYADGATALNGWLARPAGPPRAAVAVFPTIANTTPAIERRARMLADQGYLAFIVDFYGVAVESFEASGSLAKELRTNVAAYRRRIAAGIAALRNLPEASGLPVVAIGYCMGGQAVLEAARDGSELAAVVSFHGLLSTDLPAEPGAIRARVLVCHGYADLLVPQEQVTSFWAEMNNAGADWHFHGYGGVKHGFTDPGSDARGIATIGYDLSADRQSWAAMTNFLDEVLGG